MKASKIVGIACWSIVAVVLTSWLVSTICTGKSLFKIHIGGIGSGDYNYTYKYNVPENIKNININWTESYVKVSESDSSQIEITELSVKELKDEDKMRLDVNGDNLNIASEDKGYFIFFGSWGNEGHALEIKVPKNLNLKDMTVNTVSADVNVSELSADAVTLGTTSGNIQANNVLSDNIKLNTTSGDINLTGTCDTLNINSTSGNAEFSGTAKNSISSESVSGDIKMLMDICPKDNIYLKTVSGNSTLYIPENNGFTVNKSTVSGDVNIGFPTTQNGDTYIYKDGSLNINAESVSGDISINKK